jgi:hypothetical protein
MCTYIQGDLSIWGDQSLLTNKASHELWLP